MTPCEEKGYKVGDVFEYTYYDGSFPEGGKIRLSRDDGSSCPEFEGIDCMDKYGDGWAFASFENIRPIRQPQRITLDPGDYVATAGMGEETYHAVARAFIESGAADKFKHAHRPVSGVQEYLEWHRGILCGSNSPELEGRQLTPEQILGTGADTMTAIAALKAAKADLDTARDAYSKALDAVRDELGDGFMLVEAKSVPMPAENMDDPANWRSGDVVRYDRDDRVFFTAGKEYTLVSNGADEDGDVEILDNDGDKAYADSHKCTWVRRPT